MHLGLLPVKMQTPKIYASYDGVYLVVLIRKERHLTQIIKYTSKQSEL